MARKLFAPTPHDRGLVEAYTACGTPADDVARLIGISAPTLRKHFKDELDLARLRANAKVAMALFKTATDPKAGMKGVTAAIFWLKVRAGWKETTVVENTGKDGRAIETNQTVTVEFVDALDQDGLDALSTVLSKLDPEGQPAPRTRGLPIPQSEKAG